MIMAAPGARWRGFNILDLFSTSLRWKEHFPMGDGVFREEDFGWMREWGFNFARIPMSYLYFTAGPDARDIDESRIAWIDRAVEYGRRNDVHISLNLHRAPGYCVTSISPFDTPEPGNLFRNERDLELFVKYWETLAERYAGIPSEQLSFDLVNEPPFVTDPITMGDYERVYGTVLDAIADKDPDRYVLLEGVDGTMNLPPATFLNRPNVGTSTHCYIPMQISHHRCPWSFEVEEGELSWPLPQTEQLHTTTAGLFHSAGLDRIRAGGDMVWDRDALQRHLKPWLDLAATGVRVHVGETGAYNRTPHKVFLGWLDALFGVLQDHDIGWALWNFRGPFGLLDSGRADVRYEYWHGHALDAELLSLLQRR